MNEKQEKVFKRNKKVLTKFSNEITMYSNETTGGKTMKEQTLFSEEELARVETEEERNHLIECAKDNSKIDMRYFDIMKKYDLFEK